ncbi:TPA: ATP-dependent DNA helicase RecG, partial [Candidatus Uhrbacteria bacterium]|nr:ATP-dependent DNA helicase RecG [Candidatus Uhrbacteria bacterium]
MFLMLQDLVTTLPGIGPKLAKAYTYLGIQTIRDLLFAFPLRYEDFREIKGIADVEPGVATTIRGTVTSIRSRRSARKKMVLTEATIEDGTGTISAVWFHQPYIARILKTGDHLSLSGKIDDGYGLSIVNPQFEKIAPIGRTTHTGRLVPIYSTAGQMAQKGRRLAVKQALMAVQELEEWLPAWVMSRYDLYTLSEAVPVLHFPEEQESWSKAIRRMKLGELILHQLGHVQAKKLIEGASACVIPFKENRIQSFVTLLPFALTDVQKKAIYAALKDMESGRPMHRLLEGDVGSGKTVVAAALADHTVAAGLQVAYLAPTEILAVQQATSLLEILGHRASVALLTSGYQEIDGVPVKRKEVLDALIDGRVSILVGTHALLTGDVHVPKLSLVIVDEQHRFGVDQRKKLLLPDAQGNTPHFFSMTATPIPRTLAMALYGDMSISILDQLPPGRGAVETVLLRPEQDKQAYALIGDKIRKGEQAFVVCPFIEESESSDAESVTNLVQKLREGILNVFTIEVLHGKMKSKEKEEVMDRFRSGEIHILVATTVIEVGVNIPNATTIFIEGAERFGLAQLHQLRGRVRRSSAMATCFLHPTSMSGTTKERLQAMVKFDSGFELAEIDLKLRGPGDKYGTRQSGLPEFEFASLSDHALIAQAREIAEQILEEDPILDQHYLLAVELER